MIMDVLGKAVIDGDINLMQEAQEPTTELAGMKEFRP